MKNNLGAACSPTMKRAVVSSDSLLTVCRKEKRSAYLPIHFEPGAATEMHHNHSPEIINHLEV